jgi:hypothetical protein
MTALGTKAELARTQSGFSIFVEAGMVVGVSQQAVLVPISGQTLVLIPQKGKRQ